MTSSSSLTCDPNLLTGLGAVLSLFLSAAGSAVASAHAGIFAVSGNNKSYKAFVPIIQAGVLSIYGLIVAILLIGKLGGGDDDSSADTPIPLSDVKGYRNLCAGLANGLGSWASGWGMSKFMKQLNDKNAVLVVASNEGSTVGRTSAELQQPLIQQGGNTATGTTTSTTIDFKKLVLCMIFLESIGLYGLIVALFLIGK